MLMLEMTLYQLDRSTTNTFGTEREVRANRVQINSVDFTMAQGKSGSQLTTTAKIRGSTGNPYTSTIVFKKVTTEPEDTPQNVTLKGADGTDYHITAGSLNNSDVQVRCTCLDFYWRFALWNLRHKSLYGDPPEPYVKTTDRPPVNPEQKPGVCKHLYKLINQLKVRGVMQNVNHSSPKDPAPFQDHEPETALPVDDNIAKWPQQKIRPESPPEDTP